MSKAVLISIRPEWCEKIINGEKTIEVRKTRPKLQTPFKVYIYCTLPKYPHEDFITTDYPKPQFYGGGKVVGEFICDEITRVNISGFWDEDGRQLENRIADTCLTPMAMCEYVGERVCYGWHISGLKVYDTPKELDAFRGACVHSWYCDSCAMHWENNGTCGNESLRLKHPPQSWCYVENMEG